MDDLLLNDEYQEAVYYAELGSPIKGRKAIDKLLAKARPRIYQEGYEAGYQKGQEHSIGTEAEIRQNERERIIKWGIEPCPHWKDVSEKVIKRDCSLCWQALKEQTEQEEVRNEQDTD